MAKILVAGGLMDQGDPLSSSRRLFATELGSEIIRRGHVLLGGCRTELDAVVANSASLAAATGNLNHRSVIRSWVTSSTLPSHNVGEITHSRVSDWGQVPKRYAFPEPVQEADVVILLGGWDGTHYAASWARLANKPIVPVATFGLAAAEIFEDEVANFDRRNMSRVTLDEFQVLNRFLSVSDLVALQTFASDVVSLAERIITPTDVFVIMSFAEDGHLLDAYDTFVRVCKAAQFRAFKVDHHFDRNQRIVPNILTAIRKSAFIIADVSQPRPNVYYELGYAQAIGKDVIVTAQEGTELPFDIYDVPTLYWKSQGMLAAKLQAEIRPIAAKFGREIRTSEP